MREKFKITTMIKVSELFFLESIWFIFLKMNTYRQYLLLCCHSPNYRSPKYTFSSIRDIHQKVIANPYDFEIGVLGPSGAALRLPVCRAASLQAGPAAVTPLPLVPFRGCYFWFSSSCKFRKPLCFISQRCRQFAY